MKQKFAGIFILLMIIIISSDNLHAQTDTTGIDSATVITTFDNSIARVEYFTGNNFEEFITPDTSIYGFQIFNPVRQHEFEYAFLGNLGSPYYPRYFEYDRNIGFDYGRHERDLYILYIDELKYFRCNVPFTNLYYVTGSHNQQLFRGTYARNIGRDINIAFDFEKIASDGFYQRLKSDYNNVSLTGWYKNKKGNYKLYAGGIYSRHKNDEGGGIFSEGDLFETPNPEFQPPFRNEAFTEWKSWQTEVTQQLLIGKTNEYNITDTTTGNYFAPAVALKHTIGFHNYAYLFQDSEFDKTFYNLIYDNADTLRDQSDVDGYYNKLSFGNTHYKQISVDSVVERDMDWEVYALQQYHEVSDQSGFYEINNLILGAVVTKSILSDSSLILHVDGAYDITNNVYEANGNFKINKFFIEPRAGFTIAKYEPTQIQDKYFGFKYRWDNNFAPVDYQKFFAGINIEALQLDIELNIYNISNYITFNESPFFPGSEFIQLENVRVAQAKISNRIVLGDFHLEHAFAYQDRSSAVKVPELLANISWYYQKGLFKGALFSQIGFDAWWCSNYEGYSYDFIIGQWALPFVEEELSIYPVIDVFANFDIRTFRFFVKVENVAQGLFSSGYYEAPFYPMQPRGFRLGVNWMLFY